MTFLEKKARCVLVLVALSLADFAPVFLHPRQMLFWGNNDLARMAYPWRYYAVSQFQETGSIPLWFSPGMCGMPFEADCQTQLFYPPYAVFYFVRLRWIGPLFGFMLWAHVLAAGLSMFAYARYRGLIPGAALVAAIGFMFAGKWLIHLLESGHYAFLPVAWFPLLLYCAERAIECRSLRHIAGAGLFAAIIFTGSHPQLTLYSVFLAALLSLCAVSTVGWVERSEARRTAGSIEQNPAGPAPYRPVGRSALDAASTPVGVPALDPPYALDPPHRLDSRYTRFSWWALTWLGAACIAAGLAAVQLLPAVELLPQITRVQKITAQFGGEYDLVFHSGREFLKRWISLAGPQNFNGTPAESVGAFGVLWAGAALAAVGALRRKIVWLYAGVLALGILFAFNTATPVYPLIREFVPGFALFRIPTRLLLLAGFPLGMLAGYLTQELFGAVEERRSVPSRSKGAGTRTLSWRSIVASGALLAVAAMYLAISVGANWPDRFRWWPYWKFVAIAAPGLAVVVYLRRAGRLPENPGACAGVDAEIVREQRDAGSLPQNPGAGTDRQVGPPGSPGRMVLALYIAWIALLTADLWYLHSKYLVTRLPEELFPGTDVVEFLKEHPGDYRIINRNSTQEQPPLDAVTQPLCILNHLEWAFGTNPTDLASFRQFLHFVEGRDDPPRLEERVSLTKVANLQLLDLLGARYLISPADARLSSEEEPAWRLVASLERNRVLTDAGLRDLPPQNVYERTSFLPRAFVVSQALRAPAPSELLVALHATDLRQMVFLDCPGSRFEPAREPEIDSFPGPAHQPAEVISREAERIVIEVQREEPGYLVLLDAWYPGWKCRAADGSELPVWRANGFFRAVQVPRGRQRLEFTFAPKSYRIGMTISLATLAVVGCFVALPRRSRRFAGPPHFKQRQPQSDRVHSA